MLWRRPLLTAFLVAASLLIIAVPTYLCMASRGANDRHGPLALSDDTAGTSSVLDVDVSDHRAEANIEQQLGAYHRALALDPAHFPAREGLAQSSGHLVVQLPRFPARDGVAPAPKPESKPAPRLPARERVVESHPGQPSGPAGASEDYAKERMIVNDSIARNRSSEVKLLINPGSLTYNGENRQGAIHDRGPDYVVVNRGADYIVDRGKNVTGYAPDHVVVRDPAQVVAGPNVIVTRPQAVVYTSETVPDARRGDPVVRPGALSQQGFALVDDPFATTNYKGAAGSNWAGAPAADEVSEAEILTFARNDPRWRALSEPRVWQQMLANTNQGMVRQGRGGYTDGSQRELEAIDAQFKEMVEVYREKVRALQQSERYSAAAGTGTLTLSGSNTYTGGTSISDYLSVTSGATVTAANTYSGALTISGGILANGGSGSANPTVATAGADLDAELHRLYCRAASVDPERLAGTVGGNVTLSGGALPPIGSEPTKLTAGSLWPRSDSLSGPRSARQAEPTAKKPVETWKPSGLVPNTSRLMVGDKEELPLKAMQVDVRIDGFRARVVLDLYYVNDQPRQLEGNFQLRLPAEAAPYFFAFGRTVYQAPRPEPADSMFFKREQVARADTTPEEILALRRGSWEEPKVARMVPKEKAAFAYRETVRRRVDPALVEWSGAGVFQCRVFPLAPQSLHRVVIGYDVDLVRVGDDLEMRLDLPEPAPACVVDFNIAAEAKGDSPIFATMPDHASHGARVPAKIGTVPMAVRAADGRRLSYRLADPTERPIVVRVREPGAVMLTGGDGKTGGYFAARLEIPLPEEGDSPASVGPAEGDSPIFVGRKSGQSPAIFLVDTSLSAGPQFPLWNKLLRAVLENNRDRIEQFAVLFFNVENFWWQERLVPNTPENVEALVQYADGLALEGATDLAGALAEAASPGWLKTAGGSPPDLFLLSDGAATWGEDRWPAVAAGLRTARSGPVFAYHTGLAGGDSRLSAYLARETGGAVFSVVGEAEIARASTAHRARPWQLVGVEMPGGRDLLVAGRPQFVFPHQQLLVVGRCEPGLAAAEVVFKLQRGQATSTVRAKIDRMHDSELAARAYGQVAVGQLEGLAEATEPTATAYACHFRVTGQTCSLLMLESEQDYARFNIKPEEDDFVVKDRPASEVV
ncbi:MAG: autotransporter-associated beta strand repeat-containing protein, partial [Thermoguttaceae bacterium]